MIAILGRNEVSRKPCVQAGDVCNGRKVLARVEKRQGFNAVRVLVECEVCREQSVVYGFSLKRAKCRNCASRAAGVKRRQASDKKPQKLCGSDAKYSSGCRCDECRSAHAAVHRARRATEKGKRQTKHSNLKAAFGITIDQYESMQRQQDGRCAICRKQTTPLCVDHNHANNNVRGLLCHSCNRGLGLFRDSAENLSRAAEYLESQGSYHE